MDRPGLSLPETVLLDAVASLAVARTETEVAGACLPLLLDLPGVRAAAVAQRHGRAAVVLASAGYACSTMSAGADLPLDAALPVTDAIRTGRVVVQGTGPSWVALPLGGGLQTTGALLLSLTAPPPGSTSLVRLQRLAQVLHAALRRASGQDRDTALLAAVAGRLPSAPLISAGASALAVRTAPLHGGVGGDVLACLPAADGGTVLVAADVCGSGAEAAVVGAEVRAAVRAALPSAAGPASLLAAVDAAIRADVGPGCFVTAVAVHVAPDGCSARVAAAGHPSPLLLRGGRADAVALEPGPPLALEGERLPPLAETTAALADDTVLLLHTDGLTERRTGAGVRLLDARELAQGLPDDLELAADRLLAAATAVGPAQDDVSVLLLRPARR